MRQLLGQFFLTVDPFEEGLYIGSETFTDFFIVLDVLFAGLFLMPDCVELDLILEDFLLLDV